jgi:Ca2+-binding RTX toxin-like protein
MQLKSQRDFVLTSLLFLSLTGCVKQAAEPSDAGPESGSGGSIGPTSGNGGAAASGAAANGAAANGGSGVSGTGGAGPGVDGGVDAPAPDFEGIPTDAITNGMAPENCTNAGTNQPGTLVLPLSGAIRGLLISGKDGMVQVNGVTCTSVAAPTMIKVTGTTSADTVIVDLSLGALPDSLQSGGTISVDLGTGGPKDTFALATTRDKDTVHLGAMAAITNIKLDEGGPQIAVTNQENLVVSTGPGDDVVDATGADGLGATLTAAVTVFGGAGDDAIQGGNGSDFLHGGDGDDTFTTAAAADGGDTYDGGNGSDRLSYEGRTNPLTIKVNKMADDGELGERDDVGPTVETVQGGKGADNITMGDGDDTLIGGPGNDILNGGDGDDTFMEIGEPQGADVMNGGPGVDTVDYSERSGDLTVTLCIPQQATCAAGLCGCLGDDGEANEKDALVNVENVIGGRGNDKLYGSAADNLLVGNEGDDDLRGDTGDDTIYAGDGADKLSGGPGDDLLSGDNGLDMFDGGDGQGDICITMANEVPLNCELK